MEDFFKQFRDNLESRPEPKMEEKDWQTLQQRLDRRGEKRPAALGWLWLLAPLSLLLLGSNVLFYKELKNVRQQIATLETRRDTVFHTRVIYLTDTIVQTRVLREISLPALAPTLSGHTFQLQQPPFFSTNTRDTNNNSKALPMQPALAQTQNQEATVFLNSPANFEALASPEVQPLTHKQSLDFPAIPVEKRVPKSRKSLRQHLHILRPKGFHLGFSGGWAFPFSQNLNSQGGFSAGLQTAVEFSPNLRMWGEASFFNASFESRRMDDAIGVPPVDPPSAEYVFVKAEVPQPSLQYAVGMQYLFNAGGKFKPFVGIGYGAVSFLPSEVIYEFKNAPLGVEWIFEKEIRRQSWLADLLLLRTGFERSLSKRWHWQVQATYRSHLGRTGLQAPDLFGIQGGLMWAF